MRFSISPDFHRVHKNHADAYAAWNAIDADANPEAEAEASRREYEELDLMMTTPAQQAGDVLAKFETFIEREMYSWTGPKQAVVAVGDAETYTDLIRNDLLELNRPVVSGQMAAAFTAWATARREYFAAMADDGDKGDERMDGLHNAEGDAFAALLKLPCATPGDFIAKAYTNLVDSEGSGPKGQYPFLPSSTDLGAGGSRDAEYAESVRRDIADCDLGYCMMALGRTDFDAEAWVLAMDAVGGSFTIMVDPDDSDARGLWQSMDQTSERPGDRERHRILQYLIGGTFHVERANAVADLCQRDYPERCTKGGRIRKVAASEAAVA